MNTWTFLLTDIEGSTVLYEQAGEQYVEGRRRHERLLGDIIDAHGGEVVRSRGDGILAVFPVSGAALQCAAVCQAALAEMPWAPALPSVRVRIGLHRGEAERTTDDFNGLVMHHATRVLDSGHGGQIVCSEAVVEDAGESWRAQVRDLGLYRLRGVNSPVRLFEVPYASAPLQGFPPLRTPAAFTHRLPALPTRFFGRESELHELAQLLAPEPNGRTPRQYGRLVTLLGPGGTGKTRLSLAIAEHLLPAYSHAVWFVPLAEIRDEAIIPEALREALCLTPEPGVPALDQVVHHLRAQPSLLVLDNFEQLVPAGVPTVRTLLERVPQLVCLVSSRIRLELQAEQDFALLPLRLPPATGTPEELLRYSSVQLFCDRARAGRRDFRLDEKNAPAIAQICRTLEGIPLAIELAAARTTVLTPQQVVSKLGQRLDFLVGRQQDFADRHRTLRATVAWSYELLPPALQRTFAQLSIFRGGWSLEAAEAVVSEENGLAINLITELQGCSLVVAEEVAGEMRYRMLEVIREYAREQFLRAADATAIEYAHCRYFSGICGRAADLDQIEHHRLLHLEHDNVRAVLASSYPLRERCELALALRDFWMICGFAEEGARQFSLLLGNELPAELRPKLLDALGILLWKLGKPDDAAASMNAALNSWMGAKEERLAAGVLNNLGILARDRSDNDQARRFYEQSLRLYRDQAAEAEAAAVLCNLGELAIEDGLLSQAEAYLRESLSIQRRLQLQFASANTLHNLAELYVALAEPEQARNFLMESLTLRSEFRSREDLASSLATFSRISYLEGATERTVIAASACLGIADRAAGTLSRAERASVEVLLAEARRQVSSETFRNAAESGRQLQTTDSLQMVRMIDNLRLPFLIPTHEHNGAGS